MFLLLLLINFCWGLPYEYCERFPIHFDLYNCTYSNITSRRSLEKQENIEDSMFYWPCQNWGTWECSTFKCYGSHPSGYCRWGEINHNDCCTLPEIHYLDMWFKPMSSGSPYWSIEFYNFKISGYGTNVHVDNGDYHVFYDVFHGLNNETFLSIIFDYDETCVTDLLFYINGAYAFNISGEEMDIYIDFWFFTVIKEMIELQEGCDEEFYFTSAHKLKPTPERIMEFYQMGPRRPKDEEICVYLTLPELDECHEIAQAQMQHIYILSENLTECDNATTMLYDYLMQCKSAMTAWMIVAIVLGAILLILFIIFLIWVLYRLFRRTATSPLETSTTKIGEDVFF